MALRRPPSHAVPAAVVALAGVGVVLAGEPSRLAATDYQHEARPAVEQLVGGDVHAFLQQLPAYGGSLVMRAPMALLAHATGAGPVGLYRALALPCVIALAAFAVVLFAHLSAGRPRGTVAAWTALALVAFTPLLRPALQTGHPEELLGGVLCVGAVLAARRDRAVAAGLMLGLAGANKPWAILAVIPVLLALDRGHLKALATAGAACGLVLAPLVLSGSGAVNQAGAVAQGTSAIFHPWQVFWFAGAHGPPTPGVYTLRPDYRAEPGWVGALGHLHVIAVPLAVSAVAWLRGVRRDGALALLALCFLLRCVLDPWDMSYYHLPFLLAIVAFEAVDRRRMPLAGLVVTGAVVLTTMTIRRSAPADLQAALYLAWALPTLFALAAVVLAPAWWAARTAAPQAALRRALPSLQPAFRPVVPAGE